MIRPNVKMDDKHLLEADLKDMYVARRCCETAAYYIAKVVQCCPLDKDIESFKKLGCNSMELARKIGATLVAHEYKWKYGANFSSAYKKAMSLDDKGEDRFYDEVLPIAKFDLEKVAKAVNCSQSTITTHEEI